MNNSVSNPAVQRDRGLDFMKKGKEIFNQGQSIPEKEKGYEVFKKGLEYMFNYAKGNFPLSFISLPSRKRPRSGQKD
jgi:hypothetical protein